MKFSYYGKKTNESPKFEPLIPKKEPPTPKCFSGWRFTGILFEKEGEHQWAVIAWNS